MKLPSVEMVEQAQTSDEVFDPNSSPEGYFFVPLLKNEFGKLISSYVHRCNRENRPIEVVQLFCPDYPHDGKDFTYKGEMGSGLNPVVYSGFLPISELLVNRIHNFGFGIENINFRLLVCEIESDLTNVRESFSDGTEETFLDCVNSSAEKAGVLYATRFPYSRVESGTFYSLLPNLPEIQVETAKKMESLLSRGLLPDVFINKLNDVAINRTHMFTKLYGATTFDEFFALAFRQMCNYLAAYKALALRFPQGCMVINAFTPNEYYVNRKQRFLRKLLGISYEESQRLLLFKFFGT